LKTAIKSFKVFLPHITAFEIEKFGLFSNINELIFIEPLKQDWQSQFCEAIGYPNDDLPWTQLRLAQFKIDKTAKIACCIDPVMIQLTHQGAYMLGQNQLSLSQNDAIRVVAQINERLMAEGENCYLIDKQSWLFTSHKALSLSSPRIQSLIGKDMFNFPYRGDNGAYWQQFTMEIQMLIKHMIDYQGLSETAPETILNVHCFDLVEIENKELIPFIKDESISVISDNEMIKTFCCKTFLTHKSIEEYQSQKIIADMIAKKNVAIAFDSEKENYLKLIQSWVEIGSESSCKNCQIICQDGVIEFKPKLALFKRWFAFKQ
jgi:hypothetical protein